MGNPRSTPLPLVNLPQKTCPMSLNRPSTIITASTPTPNNHSIMILITPQTHQIPVMPNNQDSLVNKPTAPMTRTSSKRNHPADLPVVKSEFPALTPDAPTTLPKPLLPNSSKGSSRRIRTEGND